MFIRNPFSLFAEFVSPVVMQIYVILMILAVAGGTWLDIYHKRSAEFFTRRRAMANAAAQRPLGGVEITFLAAKTFGEAAVSGEFCKWQRRVSHLLMMYGFLLYVITTFAMVFAYSTTAATPAVLPALWDIGALMILGGGIWFFFFLRVNVANDGDSSFHIGRADLFVVSLIVSAAFALIWHFVQAVFDNRTTTLVFFVLYIASTTLLFGTVFWSKFAHMFYKPAVAFQRRIEEADGSSDLPSPAHAQHIRR
jgi:hypothetical protein